MEKENNEEKLVIEGDPGQGNTFVRIGHVENYNPNATTVNITITNNNYYGRKEGDGSWSKPADRKLGNMTLRDMLKAGYVDTTNIRPLIMNYVSCIRPLVKESMDKLFMHLWAGILEHDAFKTDLYDPGKQDCKFNRNLVGSIMHYLDGKGFYREPYNQSRMARAVEGDAEHPVRKGFGGYLDNRYCDVVDDIINGFISPCGPG